jgi:hypothetical protein
MDVEVKSVLCIILYSYVTSSIFLASDSYFIKNGYQVHDICFYSFPLNHLLIYSTKILHYVMPLNIKF